MLINVNKGGFGSTESEVKIKNLSKEIVRLKKDLKKSIDKNYKGVPVVEIDKGKKPNGEEYPIISSIHIYATDNATLKLSKKVENAAFTLEKYLTIDANYESAILKLKRANQSIERLNKDIEKLKSRGFWARVFNR